jgi:hypothetical protein
LLLAGIEADELRYVSSGQPRVVEQAQADELVVGQLARPERRLGEVEQQALIGLAVLRGDGPQGRCQVQAEFDDVGVEDGPRRIHLGIGLGYAAKG